MCLFAFGGIVVWDEGWLARVAIVFGLVISGVFVFVGLRGIVGTIKDRNQGSIKWSGNITEKRTDCTSIDGSDMDYYFMQVSGRWFSVSEKCYNWLNKVMVC
jgi:hypothetical protein